MPDVALSNSTNDQHLYGELFIVSFRLREIFSPHTDDVCSGDLTFYYTLNIPKEWKTIIKLGPDCAKLRLGLDSQLAMLD